jgi:hypothetical protein
MKVTPLKIGILAGALICASIALIGLSGCEMFASHTDPLADPKAGWKGVNISKILNNTEPDAAITKDYKDYIQNLPANMKGSVSIWPLDFFYEDGRGGHAVKIGIAVNGTWWQHVLIYDQNDKRIKVIKYISGHYAC